MLFCDAVSSLAKKADANQKNVVFPLLFGKNAWPFLAFYFSILKQLRPDRCDKENIIETLKMLHASGRHLFYTNYCAYKCFLGDRSGTK